MAVAVATEDLRPRPPADTALTAAAGLWLLTTMLGQVVFLYYIVAFYGPSTLAGDFAAWNNKPTLRGFVPGDTLGNLVFGTHVLVAAIIVFGGSLQLIPRLRTRAVAVHRWNGRLFLAAAIAAALGGLGMVWIRGATLGWHNTISVSLNAALILAFAIPAWRTARTNLVAHRRWALRTFMAANGVVFLRILYRGWALLTQASPGALFPVFEFASFLVPLALLELYLRTRRGGGPVAHAAMATTLFAVAAYTIIGAIGLYQASAKLL